MANMSNEEAKFILKVENIRTIDQFRSEVKIVQQQSWMIEISKHEAIDKNDGKITHSLAIHLLCLFQGENKTRKFVAGSNIKMLSWNDDDRCHNAKIGPEFFDSKKVCNTTLIPWGTLISPANGFIQNAAAVFDITIWANALNANNIELQDIQSGSDGGSKTKFVLSITNIHDIQVAYSHEIMVANIPWRIIVLKKGREATSNRRLVGQLQCLTANENEWSHKVSMRCKLKSFGSETWMGNDEEEALEYKESFDPKQPVHSWTIDSLDTLYDVKNGYIIDNEVFLEIEIKVEQPKRKREDADDDALSCKICFENMLNLPCSSLKCGHIFCAECLRSALRQQKLCPACRKKVVMSQIRPIYLA